jgi:transglutaminase superfamily protein
MISTCRKFRILAPERRRLVCESAALTVFVAVAVRTIPFLRLRSMLHGAATLAACARPGSARPDDIRAIGWAVAAAAARVPGATCLVRALAADAMLHRRGVRSELRLGVLRADASTVDGHAWVECDGGTIIGAADRQSDYRTLEPPGRS